MSKTIPFSSYNLQADLQAHNVTRCEMLDVILTTFVQHSCMAGHFKIKIKNTPSSNMNKQGFCPTVMMCCFGFIILCYFLHKWFPALLFITNINLADLNGKWCINMAPFIYFFDVIKSLKMITTQSHTHSYTGGRGDHTMHQLAHLVQLGVQCLKDTLTLTWGNFWFPCGHSTPEPLPPIYKLTTHSL